MIEILLIWYTVTVNIGYSFSNVKGVVVIKFATTPLLFIGGLNVQFRRYKYVGEKSRENICT